MDDDDLLTELAQALAYEDRGSDKVTEIGGVTYLHVHHLLKIDRTRGKTEVVDFATYPAKENQDWMLERYQARKKNRKKRQAKEDKKEDVAQVKIQEVEEI